MGGVGGSSGAWDAYRWCVQVSYTVEDTAWWEIHPVCPHCGGQSGKDEPRAWIYVDQEMVTYDATYHQSWSHTDECLTVRQIRANIERQANSPGVAFRPQDDTGVLEQFGAQYRVELPPKQEPVF